MQYIQDSAPIKVHGLVVASYGCECAARWWPCQGAAACLLERWVGGRRAHGTAVQRCGGPAGDGGLQRRSSSGGMPRPHPPARCLPVWAPQTTTPRWAALWSTSASR